MVSLLFIFFDDVIFNRQKIKCTLYNLYLTSTSVKDNTNTHNKSEVTHTHTHTEFLQASCDVNYM